MRVVFADLSAHSLCADVEAATAYWGAGWAAVAFCLALLVDSLDVAALRQWAALEIRVAEGLIWVHNRDAVVVLIALTDDGTTLAIDEEDTVEHLDNVSHVRVIDVACNGRRAADCRTR